MEMRYVLSKVTFPPRSSFLPRSARLGLPCRSSFPGRAGFSSVSSSWYRGLCSCSAGTSRTSQWISGRKTGSRFFVREFDRIKSNLQLTREERYSVIYRGGFGWFIACGAPRHCLLPLGGGPQPGSPRLRRCLCAPAPVPVSETFPCGHRRARLPHEGLRAHLSTEQAEGGDIIITPYLRLDKDKEDHQIPEDIRLMVEPRRKPADFLGVQMQVAVNKGPNGSVPYLYSMFLCKGKGETTRPSAGRGSGTTSASR